MKINVIETKYVVVWLVGIMFLFAPVSLITTAVEAQTTTDQMTCSQVIASYEKNGRVYVRQRSGQILPVYVGVPVSQRGGLRCDWDTFVTGYRVKSKDKKHCVPMYLCQ